MSVYRVRYQVQAIMEYRIEAPTAEEAYQKADQATWDEATCLVECIEDKEIIDEQGETVYLDWEAIHEMEEEEQNS